MHQQGGQDGAGGYVQLCEAALEMGLHGVLGSPVTATTPPEPNGTVTLIVDYDIVFSDLDRLGNIRYREVAHVLGDDTGIPGDVANGVTTCWP